MTRHLFIILIAVLACGSARGQYLSAPKKLTSTISWSIGADSVLRITGTGEMPDMKEGKAPWLSPKISPLVKAIEVSEGITRIGNYNLNFFPILSPGSIYVSPSKKHPRIPIDLPNSLEYLGFRGVTGCCLSRSELPESFHFGTFGHCSFPGDSVIVNTPYISFGPVEYCIVEKLVVGEKVENAYRIGTWVPDHLTDLKTIEIRSPKFNPDNFINSYSESYEKKAMNEIAVKGITIVLPDNSSYQAKSDKPNTPTLDKFYHLTTASELARQERDRTCSGYIANRLPAWEKYLEQSVSVSIPTPETAQAAITADIEKWRQKGEFETTAEWQARVNPQTTQARVDRLTAEWNDKARRAQSEWNAQVVRLKEEYAAKYKQLQDEFYANLADTKRSDYRRDKWQIAGPYDADNQTFLLSSENHGDILLGVGRAEASAFKQNWPLISCSVRYQFVPVSETEVGLSKIIFDNDGREYVYDGKQERNYAVATPDYDFQPVEITGLELNLAALDSGQLAVNTPRADTSGKTITARRIERTVQTGQTGQAQASAGPRTAAASGSDVDRDIPAGGRTNDKTFALVIANENYRRVAPVAYAARDGQVIRQYLNKTLGIPERNIKHVEDASLNDMQYQLDLIGDICEAYGGEASLIVYYAGHGVPDPKGGGAYLLPVDGYAERATSGLAMQEVISTLAAMPAKEVTLLVDACFSGLNRRGESLSETRGVAIKPQPSRVTGNVVMLSAAQGQQTAQPLDDEQHGMFTYFLLKKLRDTRGDVTLGDLSDYIIDSVRRESAVNGTPQTPTVNAPADNTTWRTRRL